MQFLIGSAYVLLILMVVALFLIRNVLLTRQRLQGQALDLIRADAMTMLDVMRKSERHLGTMLRIIHHDEMEQQSMKTPVTSSERAKRSMLDEVGEDLTRQLGDAEARGKALTPPGGRR